MTRYKQPTILFRADIPATSSHDHDSLVILEEEEHKPYKEAILKPGASSIAFPSDFSDPEIPEGSIAYHPIFGDITYRSWWRFSTAQFMADLQAAEENPAIIAHLIHVDSPGGEAFGLHEAFQLVKSLKKPCFAVIESMAASAGYYLAAAADRIYTTAKFSLVGCIGIVGAFWDDSKWLEDHGIKEHEYYSTYSPLKNKIFRDAMVGDGEEYIKRYLDPMALQFIEDVKSVRKDVTQAAQEGDTYYSEEAQAAGLIDGQKDLDTALDELIRKATPKPQSPSVDINKLNL